MTNQETYPLHRCVFRNDVESLDKNLKDEEIKKLINQKDNHGNTPIHLALMLDRRNCILSLLRNGCDTITRNVFEWNPLEEATMLGDVDLIEKISKLKFRDYCIYFNKTGTNGTVGKLDEWNQSLPYCRYKAQIKIKSKIPLLSKIGIKDIVHFYKNENSIRFDSGVAGIDVRGIPRVISGNLSFIVNRLDNGLSKIYMLDNKNKRYTELFPYIPQTVHDQVIKSKTDVKTLYKFFIDNTNLTIKKKTPSGFSFKNSKKRTIRVNNKKYTTELFKIKNIGVIIRKRDNEQVIGDFKSDIKTTIADIDQSRNRVHKTLTSEINNIISDNNLNGIGVDEIFQNENEENNSGDESDSDSDDSDIENDDDDSKSVSSHSSSSAENKNEDDQKDLEEISNLNISDKDEEADKLKKSNNMSSMVHSITENYYNSTFKKRNNDTNLKDDKINRIPISEEEYFDPSNTESLHMGRVMEISEEKRHTAIN